MRYRLLVLFVWLTVMYAKAQVLRTINYNYIYRPAEEFTFSWKVLPRNNQVEIMYLLERNSETVQLADYDVLWEARKDLSEKEGKPVNGIQPAETTAGSKSGKVVLDASVAGQIIVARVTNATRKRVWLYFQTIPSIAQPYLMQNNRFLLKNYARIDESLSIHGFETGKPLIVSYYSQNFPSAAPPFSTAQARVAPVMKPDSIYGVTETNTVSYNKTGLYLIQQDTTSATGLAFRIEDDYPKLGRIESLAGPLIYICTKQEYDKLKAAGNDKAAFDKVILTITGNTDRARTFMRSYFRNVELANRYFSSYKEGWKTDRGMIYIIYGLPDAVYILGDREVWEYKNNAFSGQFTFVKSASVFDPENFVLVRDKSYQDTWYQMIDLWRKARF
jgi:GWxTD domain-containing protein